MVLAVEGRGLTKSFGEVAALDGVDIVIEEGRIHGLLGPNGAGKSTLLRILFGLVQPDGGTVSILGRTAEYDGIAAVLAPVAGFVDRPSFYPYLTARRTLALLASIDGNPDPGIDDVLALTGLTEAADRRISGWSTGMRQRLGLAAALIRKPSVLLLDEPTEGLDPNGTRELTELLRILASSGVTVLISSHDMAEVDAMCDGATILMRGRVAMAGPLTELRAVAPIGRHRLVTSDDPAARGFAAHHAVTVDGHPQGGLTLEAGAKEMHAYICELGRHDISVVRLEQDIAPLTALFYRLTSEADELVGTA